MADEHHQQELRRLERRAARERAARKEAERLLEERGQALFRANQELASAAEELEFHVQDRTRELAETVERLASEVLARESVEQNLREAITRAEAANRAKSGFLANMSHEIRTPMNGVIGMLDLLGESGLDEDQASVLDTIQESANALLALINDILDMARIEAGKLRLDPVPFATVRLVASVVGLFEGTANHKGLKLRWSVAEDVPAFVVGDDHRIRQMLSNLVGNAIKFTEQGEVALRVTLDRQDSGVAHMRFTIQDTGIGIAEERLEAVFGQFSQEDSSTTRRFGGTGLGLALCQDLSEMMGGEIRVESRVGEGSTFVLTLPLPNSQTDGLPAAAEAPEPQAALPFLGGQRVLLVDDHPINRLVAGRMLKKLGVEYDEAEDGLEALERLRARRYELVLLDMMMPRMDGFEVAEQVRTGRFLNGVAPELAGPHSTWDTPIVALTAKAMPGDREVCIEWGMNDYLAKPFKLGDLRKKLQCYLDVDLPMVRDQQA